MLTYYISYKSRSSRTLFRSLLRVRLPGATVVPPKYHFQDHKRPILPIQLSATVIGDDQEKPRQAQKGDKMRKFRVL